MKNNTGTHTSSRMPRWLNMLAASGRWLIEPSSSVVEPDRRLRAHLLIAMLLILLVLALLSLVLTIFGVYSQPAATIWITIAAVLLFGIEYRLSRGVHYQWAAAMLVGTVLVATFLSAIVNPTDSRALFFLVLGGLIANLFLSAGVTEFVFLATFAGLLLLPLFVTALSTSTEFIALFFILMVGGLVVMAAILRRRYLKQIDWQTQQLVESETRLRELSIRDPLTELFNRRYLEEALALEMIRSRRKQSSIGIIMVDIDRFKQFNDTHGHAAGDAVLIQVGNFFRSHIRSSDITCRFGGEEFIIVMTEATPEITRRRSEHIRTDVSQLHVEYEGRTLEPVTLSIGVAVFPIHGSTIDEILRAADKALYRAKHEGGDLVAAAD
jgi:diguanylate cyclase (GGDEF)-like protein